MNIYIHTYNIFIDGQIERQIKYRQEDIKKDRCIQVVMQIDKKKIFETGRDENI